MAAMFFQPNLIQKFAFLFALVKGGIIDYRPCCYSYVVSERYPSLGAVQRKKVVAQMFFQIIVNSFFSHWGKVE